METPNKDGQQLPMLTPKNTEGSQRVIKQIMVIDPKKLRVAGLDLKMAEALKKAKGRQTTSSSGVRSRDEKHVLAKNILNNKLKQAKVSKEPTLSQISSLKSVEEAARKLSFANATKVYTPKPQIKVAPLKSLMPPPSLPVAPSHNKSHTMLFSIMKADQKSGAIEVKLLNPPIGPQKNSEPVPIRKPSFWTAQAVRPPEKPISPEVKFEIKKKLQQKAMESPSSPVTQKSLPKVIESKVLSPEEKIDLSTLCVKPTTEIICPIISKQRVNPQNIALDLSKIEENNVMNKHKEGVTRKSQNVVRNTGPPKVATLSTVVHSPKEVSSEPVVEESAIDFINNLFMIAEKSKKVSKPKAVAKQQPKSDEEDATSFLVSLLNQNTAKASNETAPPKVTPLVVQKSNDVVVEASVLTVVKPMHSQQTISSEVIKGPAPTGSIKTDESLASQEKIHEASVTAHDSSSNAQSVTPQRPESVMTDNSQSRENDLTKEQLKNVEKAVGTEKLISAEVTSNPCIDPTKATSPLKRDDTEQLSSNIKNSGSNKKDEDNLTQAHHRNPTSETAPVLLDKVEECPPTSHTNTRRKGRKSVPVLVAKLNRNRRPPVSKEKPDQISTVSSVSSQLVEESTLQEKSSEEVKEILLGPPSLEHSVERVHKDSKITSIPILIQESQTQSRENPTALQAVADKDNEEPISDLLHADQTTKATPVNTTSTDKSREEVSNEDSDKKLAELSSKISLSNDSEESTTEVGRERRSISATKSENQHNTDETNLVVAIAKTGQSTIRHGSESMLKSTEANVPNHQPKTVTPRRRSQRSTTPKATENLKNTTEPVVTASTSLKYSNVKESKAESDGTPTNNQNKEAQHQPTITQKEITTPIVNSTIEPLDISGTTFEISNVKESKFESEGLDMQKPSESNVEKGEELQQTAAKKNEPGKRGRRSIIPKVIQNLKNTAKSLRKSSTNTEVSNAEESKTESEGSETQKPPETIDAQHRITKEDETRKRDQRSTTPKATFSTTTEVANNNVSKTEPNALDVVQQNKEDQSQPTVTETSTPKGSESSENTIKALESPKSSKNFCDSVPGSATEGLPQIHDQDRESIPSAVVTKEGDVGIGSPKNKRQSRCKSKPVTPKAVKSQDKGDTAENTRESIGKVVFSESLSQNIAELYCTAESMQSTKGSASTVGTETAKTIAGTESAEKLIENTIDTMEATVSPKNKTPRSTTNKKRNVSVSPTKKSSKSKKSAPPVSDTREILSAAEAEIKKEIKSAIGRTPRSRKKTAKFEEYSKGSLNQTSPTNHPETTEETEFQAKRTAKGKVGQKQDPKCSQLEKSFDLLRNEKVVNTTTKPDLPDSSSRRISDASDGFVDGDFNLPLTMENEAPVIEETAKDDTNKPDEKTPKQKSAKNPFRKVKSEGKEQKKEEPVSQTTTKDIHFRGFNEKEIKEGKQSTSLRLSQSEDVAPPQLALSAKTDSKKKKSPQVRKTSLSGGKKQQFGQSNWNNSLGASLKNWLTTPDKSTEEKFDPDNEMKTTKEMNLSIPLKKRRERDQKSIKDDAKLLQEHTSVTAIKDGQEQQPDVEAKECTPSPNPQSAVIPSKKGKTKTKKASLGKNTSVSEDDLHTPRAGKQKKTSKLPTIKNKKTKSANEDNVKPPQVDLKTPSKLESGKRKRACVEENTSDIECPTKIPHISFEIDPMFAPSAPRRRGRPSKVTYMPSPAVSPLEKKYKNDTEFNPRLLLIRQKEDLKTDAPLIDPDLQTVPKSKDDVQCALCMGYTAKKKWLQHISGHYGIGWIVGTPPPLNVKSRGSVMNFMVDFFKTSKVKGLNCRLCQSLRRSAVGLLVHLEQCVLTDDELKESRVVCEYCNNDYSRSSIIIHVRTCPKIPRKSKTEEEDKKATDPGHEADQQLSNTGRLKRKSVIKAENKLKNLDDNEFIPDELIKHIPQQNPENYENYLRTWASEIQSLDKGFCVERKCLFTAATVEELQQHYREEVCPFFQKPGYSCSRCKFHADTIEPVRAHVLERHKPKQVWDFENSCDEAEIGSELSSESMSSGDEEVETEEGFVDENGVQKPKRKKDAKKGKTKKKRIRIQKNISTKDFKKLLPDREQEIASFVGEWYQDFVKRNYSKTPLFTSSIPNVTETDISGYESYFPKSPVSMKFILNGFKGFVKEFGKTSVEPNQWQNLERLKGTELPQEHTMYIGGPVKAIAWAPLEPHPPSSTQYLAVAIKKGIDKYTRFLQPKRSRSLVYIQKYNISDSPIIHGDIHYAITIDTGPVHCIEFLPSGGYAPEMNRLGLLAVGTVETEVNVYALPLEVQKKDCDIFPIVRLEPSFALCLDLAESPKEYSNEYQSQCMSLVWSQTAGHNYIIGGYLNGFVAIWDISNEEDNLNRFLVNDVIKFVPVSYFWTMDNRINQIVAHYDMNGLRWLAVCNSTRQLLLYDLREITKPILFYVDTTKNICNSMDWPVVWENPSYGVGDAMPSHGSCINTISPMSLVFVNRRFDKFCCGVNDIHFNCWRNLYVGGSDNGDVHVTLMREAVLDVGCRLKNDEKAISTLDIVPLDGSIHKVTPQNVTDGERLLEADNKEKYGLVFGTTQRIKGSTNPSLYGKKRIPTINLTCLTRVNRVRFNPNRNANDLLAIGYDNGFLRILRSDWHKTLKETKN